MLGSQDDYTQKLYRDLSLAMQAYKRALEATRSIAKDAAMQREVERLDKMFPGFKAWWEAGTPKR